ncbi:hypothetical protein HGRIS_003606 [Hohenbuehelia grisea]|uniref:Terpene synthase n=1 Tax=Hohenbuehelia grisea TaxID=104357 RepID=A0ABR3JHP5_9AGAR
MSTSQFVLPDLLSMCPLEGFTNPHYERAAEESRAWINSYNVFTDRKRAFFVQGCNELLVSHTFPYAGYEEFRTCCDLVNLLFVIDEVSDDQSGKDARATGQVFLNALGDPEWNDNSLLSRITKDFRTRYFRLAGPKTSKRFLKHCEDYINAVSIEAELRERDEVLDLEPFTNLRRENSAIRLCFGLFEYALGIDLPQEVFEDQTFMDMYFAAVDMVAWSNDVYSYNMEQAKGHTGNNVVTVLMQWRNMTLQEASNHVGVHFQKLVDTYMSSKDKLPSWGAPVDADVARYVQAAGHWARGNLE